MHAISTYSSFLRYFFSIILILMVVASLLGARALGQESALTVALQPLISQPVDESQLTPLRGNTHPLARPQFDLGTAPASLPMERMLLVLKRSPAQESALRKLLDDQQDKNSPSYHQWLTPEEFGKQFGPTDSDMQTITSWLQSHGFQVGTTKGRTVLEFSGSASQVQEAFHTAIHKYIVNGEQHWANASDPKIPTALTGAVAGILSLHNFIKRPASHFSGEALPAKLVPGKKPQVTFSQNGQNVHALGLQDYATIYNINPIYNNGINGNGVTIGVVARSNMYDGNGQGTPGADVFSFRSVFGLTAILPNVILNGPDPGDLGGGEEAEATLDASWSWGIAPSANLDFVVSATTNTTDGVDLSEVYIVDNNLADIMTESFSSCELYATDAQIEFSTSLAEQADAQGITYFVSTGDNGAEGCDDPSAPPATHPVSVNLLASTAFNVAVGGTMFNENGQDGTYWGTEPPVQESAISYIPEDVWNESSSTNGLWAGSGGVSAGNNQGGLGGTRPGVPKPSWQSPLSLGIPNDGARDLPDVSLTAAGHDPYLLCLEDSCFANTQGQFFVYFISGTSASAPSFAGIMALIDQKMGGRQGQANYVLYPLAAAQQAGGAQCNASSTSGLPNTTCVFNDVTVGNNSVPGESGYPNGLYAAQTGYDQATGLGSVNVANLVNAWASATFRPTTTSFKLNGGTTPITIQHGAEVTYAISVAPNSGSGTPSGQVSLMASVGGATGGVSGLLGLPLANGTYSSTTYNLPGGTTYQLHAHYPGDGIFAASDSNTITATVTPEASATAIAAVDRNNQAIIGNTLPFGSLVFVRADVLVPLNHGTPTGMVTFADSFGNLPGPVYNPVPNPASLNSEGNTSIGAGVINFDAGSHSISAAYGGDASFSASSSTAPVTFTIQPGFAGVSGPTNVTISSPGLSGTSTVGIVASTGFTTAVSFACSGLPAESTCISSPATGSGPNTIVNTNVTITTTAAHTTKLQESRQYYFAAIFGGGLPLAGIFLIVAPRRRHTRVLLGFLTVTMLAILPSCGGGGGGGGHQDLGTPTGTYQVTITATAGSLSQHATFSLTVQ
jgi:hypothetical protein